MKKCSLRGEIEMIKLAALFGLGVLLSSSITAAEIEEIMLLDSKLSSMNKAGLGAVVFPHKTHESLYACNDCHPKLFVEKRGGNDINMEKNSTGQACGAAGCHNSSRAFPLYLCDHCHLTMDKGTQPSKVKGTP